MGTYSITQLYNKIGDLATQKESLRQALLAQGADVSTNVLLDDYPTIIDNICGHPDIRLEYLQADETPSSHDRTEIYFDTGIYPDSSTNIDVVYQNTFQYSSTSKQYTIIGCSQTVSGGGFPFSGSYYFLSPGSTSSTARAYRFSNTSSIAADTSIAINTDKHRFISYNNGLNQTVYFDGVSTTGSTSTFRTFGTTMRIFALNENNSNNNHKALKGTRIYYIKIFESNSLIRYYIPVLHWNGSQYVACFYDSINNNYIYNLGTGTLVYKIR